MVSDYEPCPCANHTAPGTPLVENRLYRTLPETDSTRTHIPVGILENGARTSRIPRFRLRGENVAKRVLFQISVEIRTLQEEATPSPSVILSYFSSYGTL